MDVMCCLWSHVSNGFPTYHLKEIFGNKMENRTENIDVPLWKSRVYSCTASWRSSILFPMVQMEESEKAQIVRDTRAPQVGQIHVDYGDGCLATHWDTRTSRQLMTFQWQQRSSCLHYMGLNCPGVQGISNSHRVRSQQDRPVKDCWTPVKDMARSVLNGELLGLGWYP